jgi:hypothetical protein
LHGFRNFYEITHDYYNQLNVISGQVDNKKTQKYELKVFSRQWSCEIGKENKENAAF